VRRGLRTCQAFRIPKGRSSARSEQRTPNPRAVGSNPAAPAGDVPGRRKPSHLRVRRVASRSRRAGSGRPWWGRCSARVGGLRWRRRRCGRGDSSTSRTRPGVRAWTGCPARSQVPGRRRPPRSPSPSGGRCTVPASAASRAGGGPGRPRSSRRRSRRAASALDTRSCPPAPQPRAQDQLTTSACARKSHAQPSTRQESGRLIALTVRPYRCVPAPLPQRRSGHGRRARSGARRFPCATPGGTGRAPSSGTAPAA
jgi:hypothetical protein